MEEIKIIITQRCIDRYNTIYFEEHPRAQKKPVSKPQHPSLNVVFSQGNHFARSYMKKSWENFIIWKIKDLNLDNLQIEKCRIFYKTYFYQNTRHDLDNISPKYFFDGFVKSGLIVDDSFKNIVSLTTECDIDKINPRIEIYITILGYKENRKHE